MNLMVGISIFYSQPFKYRSIDLVWMTVFTGASRGLKSSSSGSAFTFKNRDLPRCIVQKVLDFNLCSPNCIPAPKTNAEAIIKHVIGRSQLNSEPTSNLGRTAATRILWIKDLVFEPHFGSASHCSRPIVIPQDTSVNAAPIHFQKRDMHVKSGRWIMSVDRLQCAGAR